MPLFNLLWNFSLGIIGGIVSSVIVSKVFLIQSEYKAQIAQFERLFRKLGYVDGMLSGIKTVLEFSYDSDTKMKQEMDQYGYKTEREYYVAHKEARWISEEDLLKNLLAKTQEMATTAKDDLMNTQITEKGLLQITNHLAKYMSEVTRLKECSFNSLRKIEVESKAVQDEFENYRKCSTKVLLKMILSNKLMIGLYVFVALILVATVLTYCFGI